MVKRNTIERRITRNVIKEKFKKEETDREGNCLTQIIGLKKVSQ